MEKTFLNNDDLISILKFEKESNEDIQYIHSTGYKRIKILNARINLSGIEGDVDNCNIVFKNCDFECFTGIKLQNFRANIITFIDCFFEDVVEFDHILASLEFNNCTFVTITRISNLETEKYSRVENSKFLENIYITDTKKTGGFIFSKNKFEKDLLISGNYKRAISFNNNEFQGDLTFGQGIGTGKVMYSKLSYFFRISIQSGHFYGKITFSQIHHRHKLWITNSEIEINRIEISESLFIEEFALAHAKIDSITIFGGKFCSSFKTNFAKINEIYICGGRFRHIDIKEGFLNRLQIIGKDEIDNLDLSENILTIQQITISQSNPIKLLIKKIHGNCAIFRIRDLNFENSALNKDSIVQVYDIEISKISFNYFINLGVIAFSNLLFYSKMHQDKVKKFKLYLINSDLGKTSFLNCRSTYSSSNEFFFTNSKLLDSYFSNDELFENPKFIETNNFDNFKVIKNQKEALEQEEELYNQLKSLHEKKSNIIPALNYKAKSFNVRRRRLYQNLSRDMNSRKTSIPIFNFYHNIVVFFLNPVTLFLNGLLSFGNKKIRRDFYDYVVLSSNNISNRHGVSWQRALISLIAITSLSYSFYCYLSGLRLGSWNEPVQKEYFIEVTSYIGDFLTPLNKTDTYIKFYPERKSPNFPKARLFALFSQIVIGYFIYQLIQAFRKLGKN